MSMWSVIGSVVPRVFETADDNDDIMLPLRQRRLPSYIAIDDVVPPTKPSSDTGSSQSVAMHK